MDTLVIDIETKNTLGDVGGKEFLDKLEISVVGVYSYNKNEYRCFEEREFEQLKKLLSERALLIGFSANKFDFPILEQTLKISLREHPRIDISDEIERESGRLIGLGVLARLNLGIEKGGRGLMAPVLYREGKIKELKTYCIQDVKITKELFDKIKNQGFVVIPDRETDKPEKVKLKIDTTVSW